MMKIQVFLCLLFLINGGVYAQTAPSRDELKAKREELNKKIQKTSQQLQKTKTSRQSVSKEVNSLQKKVRSRTEAVNAMREEVEQINADIRQKEQRVLALMRDLKTLKASYQELLVTLYRYKIQQNPAHFFLSAAHLIQSYQRQQFLLRLEDRQYRQGQAILTKQADLQRSLAALKAEKSKKDQVLNGEIKEKTALDKELKTKDQLATKLKKKEQALQGELAQQEKARRQLNEKIESVIRQVIAGQKQDALTYPGTKTPTNTAPATAVSVDDKQASSAFVAQKGRLPRPASGKVVSGFGKQVHPHYPEVFVVNNGIDIKTASNAAVQAVHAGVVVSVFAIPGNGNAVMIRHGDYYTTYSNLAAVSVKRGATVKARDKIGTVGKNTDGAYLLHFELWKGKNKENPSAWLGG